MQYSKAYHLGIKWILVWIFICFAAPSKAQYGVNDTIKVAAVIYEGDTIEAKTLVQAVVYYHLSFAQRQARAEWTRLRNAVYVCYPYAKRAGRVLNDVNAHLIGVTNPAERRKYIKSREKELRKEFTEPLMNLLFIKVVYS